MKTTIKQQLIEMAEPEYQQFSAALLPTIDNVLGVRLPKLRTMAKAIAKGDWRSYLSSAETDTFEEIMLQGMVIGYAKTDCEERLRQIATFVPKIDNWSVCDSFCIGLTFTNTNKAAVWEFLQPYLASQNEYEVRFGVVMLLDFYIEEAYIQKVFACLDNASADGYYAKMAIAWAVSMCFVKMPEQTIPYLRKNALDDFTYNKALQKITESNRVDSETKKVIRQMKRK
ncbi:DNA alkylation repair protein [Brevibacillus fluminis]|uniref:DNA alkylation repair protein n=1 Tax=Brevibacillus fluminis TaxID=511487 RepID=A0A3M8DR45_9BACL|nr:DNA alkylation repair protein [Brevibacillus fluminis]RNB90434.1 DNA alkylation repair protein [Brevibacillus fluminis]